MGDIVVLEHEWKEHCARDVLKITLRLENESVLRMVGLVTELRVLCLPSNRASASCCRRDTA